MAIAVVNGAVASLAVTNTSLSFAAAAQTSGNRIVIAIAILTTSSTISSITDGTNTFTLQSSQNNGSAVRVELWACTIAGSATRTITINFSSTTLASAAYEQYSGSTAIGNIATPATGSSTYPESDVATQDASNWSVAAIAAATSSGDTFGTDLGVIRQSTVPALTTAAVALIDNSSVITVPGLRMASLISASRSWAAASLELRTGAAAITEGSSKFIQIPQANAFANHQATRQQPINTGSGSGGNSGYIG